MKEVDFAVRQIHFVIAIRMRRIIERLLYIYRVFHLIILLFDASRRNYCVSDFKWFFLIE